MHVLVFVSPVEILGHSLKFFCVGLSIMNLKLFDAYRTINSRILAVTMEYLVTLELVDVYHMVLF